MNKKYIPLVIFFTLIVGLSLYSWENFATDRRASQSLKKISQNAYTYHNNKSVKVSDDQQSKFAQKYLVNYYSPWNVLSRQQMRSIKHALIVQYKKLEETPGVGENTHAYSVAWIKSLEKNSDMKHFNYQKVQHHNQEAITVHDSNIRILPTYDPSYTNFSSISQGYPFDNLQQTYIPAGTPIRILHISKDKAWDLVYTASYSGWIPDQDVALVSPEFKKRWQTKQYAVSKRDNIPLLDSNEKLVVKTRIGVLYPVTEIMNNNFKILTPVKTSKGDAIVKSVLVSPEFLTKFPVPISHRNIAEVLNNLIGKPYGWGGLYGYRDCSSTTKDLMATFGIWLPRNSADQQQAGKIVSLKGLSDAVKEKLIIKKGVPMLSLIHMPGHIVLYVGEKNNRPMVFQNMWGLHVYKLFNNKDRIVIGKTVITPLQFGSEFINTATNNLKRADSLIGLLPTVAS